MTASEETFFRMAGDTTAVVSAIADVGTALDGMVAKLEATDKATRDAKESADNFKALSRSLADSGREQAAIQQAAVAEAQAARQAQQAAIGDIRARTAMAAGLRASIDGVGVSEREQLEILKRLGAQAQVDSAILREMFVEGTIGAEQFAAELQRVEDEAHGIGAAAAAKIQAVGTASTKSGALVDGFRGRLGGLAGEFANASDSGITFGHVVSGAVGGALAGGVTAGIAAVGAGLRSAAQAASEFGQASVREFLQAEAAANRLDIALDLRGFGEGHSQQLQALAAGLQATTKYSDDAALQLEQLAVSMLIPMQDIPAFVKASADLAAVLGVDLVTAGRQLAQTFDGSVGALGQRIPALQSLTEEQLKAGVQLDVLRDQIGGFAEKEAADLEGRLATLSNQWGELKETIGGTIVGAVDARGGVSALTEIVAGLGVAVEGSHGSIQRMIDALPRMAAAIPGGLGVALSAVVSRLRGAGAERLAAQREAAGAPTPGSVEDDATSRETQSRLEAMYKVGNARALANALASRDIAALTKLRDQGKVSADQYEASLQKINDALESEAEKARNAGKALRDALDGISGRAAVASTAGDRIAALGLPDAETVDEYRGQISALSADEKALRQLYLSKSITLTEYNERLAAVDASRGALIDSARPLEAALQAERVNVTLAAAAWEAKADWQKEAARQAEEMTDDGGPADYQEDISGDVESQRAQIQAVVDSRRADTDSLVEHTGWVREAAAAQGELMTAQEAFAEAERLIRDERLAADTLSGDTDKAAAAQEEIDLMVAKGEATAEYFEQEIAFQTELRDLKAEMLENGATALEVEEALADATERHASAQIRQRTAMEIAAKSMEKNIKTKIAMRQATIASAGAMLQEALAGTLSARSLLKAGLEYLAQWAGKKSLAAFASAGEQAALYTASHGTDADAAAAAAQFVHTGTMWGVLAAGAGVAAGAVGSGGGGGGGKGGKDDLDVASLGGAGGRSEFSSTRERVEQGQQAPNVSVIFNGSHHVGDMEELARRFTPVIQQALREQGGRDGSVRL